MPIQGYVVKRERRVGLLVFYKLGSKYYFRTRSSLSGHRVKTSHEFKNTMTYAHRLGIASRLASMVYRKLPPAWKLHDLYRKLTGHAVQWLNDGMDPNLVLRKLSAFLVQLGYQSDIQYPVIQPSSQKLKIKKQPKLNACTTPGELIPTPLSLLIQPSLPSIVALNYAPPLLTHKKKITSLRAPPSQ